jgi:hypothetical protein
LSDIVAFRCYPEGGRWPRIAAIFPALRISFGSFEQPQSYQRLGQWQGFLLGMEGKRLQ